MQARIVNLQEFLKVHGQPDFSVEITDEIIPENNISLGEGKREKNDHWPIYGKNFKRESGDSS